VHVDRVPASAGVPLTKYVGGYKKMVFSQLACSVFRRFR